MGHVAGADSLTPGEELVLRLHPHGKTMAGPSAILLLVVAGAITLIFVLPANAAHLWPIRLAIGVAALVAVTIWFVTPFLRWRTTVYEVTTRRLRLREGIVTKTGRDFPLNRITDVSFSQGVFDRVFGCGRLTVESPGEYGRLVLTEIPSVQRVQSVLFELVGEDEARLGGVGQDDGT
jgi:uncharacterized membrane protein YdbT with pleckstrin-like domain